MVAPNAEGCRNHTQCDSLLLADVRRPYLPVIDVKNAPPSSSTKPLHLKISAEQLFYCNQRGIPTEEAVG